MSFLVCLPWAIALSLCLPWAQRFAESWWSVCKAANNDAVIVQHIVFSQLTGTQTCVLKLPWLSPVWSTLWARGGNAWVALSSESVKHCSVESAFAKLIAISHSAKTISVVGIQAVSETNHMPCLPNDSQSEAWDPIRTLAVVHNSTSSNQPICQLMYNSLVGRLWCHAEPAVYSGHI